MKLINNKAFEWEKHGKVNIKGFYQNPVCDWTNEESDLIKSLFNKQIVSTEVILGRMNNAKSLQEILDTVNLLNGQFAVVIEDEDYIFAAVDNIRSIPLFYKDSGEGVKVSDISYELLEDKNPNCSNEALRQFELSGCTWANSTLVEGINSLSAGEYLYYDKASKELKIDEYMRFEYRNDLDQSEQASVNRIVNAYKIAAKRLAKLADGNTIMIPLSGGEDSRIVAHTLKSIGYENVICYSYGVKGNAESNVSKSIAEHLGYKWIFAPFDEVDWRSWYTSDEYREFSAYSSNLVSTPHFQDYHAVRYFKEHDMIPENAIFCPGHSGDFIHGDHIPSVFIKANQLNIKYLAEELFREVAINKDFKGSSTEYSDLLKAIIREINPKKDANRDDMISYYEYFDWKEKQSKMIANAVRVYEFFGYRWHMMLWNRTVFEAWETVVPELRYHRRLHYKIVTVEQKALREAIGTTSTGNPDGGVKNAIKDIIRRLMPSYYRKIFFNYKNRNMINEYDTHHLDWYKIKTREEFDLISAEYSSINGIVSADMIDRFKKDYDWKK